MFQNLVLAGTDLVLLLSFPQRHFRHPTETLGELSHTVCDHFGEDFLESKVEKCPMFEKLVIVSCLVCEATQAHSFFLIVM